MIDPRLLRDDADALRAAQRRRGEPTELVDDLVAADERRRSSIAAFETVRAEQKNVGKLIAQAQGEEKQALLAQTKQLSAQVKEAEAAQNEAAEAFDTLLRALPNPASEEAPEGGEDDFEVLEVVGTPRDFAAEGFEPRDHLELGQLLGAIDVERGAKVSGARFYYLTGVGRAARAGAHPAGDGQGGRVGLHADDPAGPGQAERHGGHRVPRAGGRRRLLPGEGRPLPRRHRPRWPSRRTTPTRSSTPTSLPIRYAGFSPCYRREAGSYGKDTRGIFRVHWFDKVEMFVFTTLEESYAEHERIVAWERAWLDALELPYRVIDVPAGDLGLSAIRKFDCEAWIPTQERYREVSSASNCTQYQARRLDIRHRGEMTAPPRWPRSTARSAP